MFFLLIFVFILCLVLGNQSLQIELQIPWNYLREAKIIKQLSTNIQNLRIFRVLKYSELQIKEQPINNKPFLSNKTLYFIFYADKITRIKYLFLLINTSWKVSSQYQMLTSSSIISIWNKMDITQVKPLLVYKYISQNRQLNMCQFRWINRSIFYCSNTAYRPPFSKAKNVMN